MKKTILFAATILFLASCGGAKMSKEDQQKMAVHIIDSLNVKLETQVNDYCKCLETKGIKDCQPIYVDLCATDDSVSRRTRDASLSAIITPEDYKKLNAKTVSLFDRKAECAKAAMKRDGN